MPTPIAEFEAQAELAPGTEGWWKVWGAQVRNIQVGDLVLEAADKAWIEITDTFEAKAAPLRFGFVDQHGERFTLGVLCPIVVVRRGTHNTLAR